MSLHPISGLFSSGEGPALRLDADGCAHEDSGRWRSRRCRDTDPTHLVYNPRAEGSEAPVCTPHAEAWRGTSAVTDGLLAVVPLDRLEGC